MHNGRKSYAYLARVFRNGVFSIDKGFSNTAEEENQDSYLSGNHNLRFLTSKHETKSRKHIKSSFNQ